MFYDFSKLVEKEVNFIQYDNFSDPDPNVDPKHLCYSVTLKPAALQSSILDLNLLFMGKISRVSSVTGRVKA